MPLVKIASGGMATVFVGTLRGPLGFSQLVAIKRPHEHLLEDEAFRRSLIDEARVAAQIRHANVVDVRDVEVVGDSIQLIMDYVEGASFGQLMAVAGRAGRRLPPAVVVRVVLDALAGLSAVHKVTDADGIPLGLVHRDISPQNILVGVDGVSRVTDFGIAMAEYGAYTPTTQGTLKGKLGYLAPEYIRGIRPDQRVDVFAMGVVLWEALVGRRLFKGANDADALDKLLHQDAPKLSQELAELAPLDVVLERALAKAPEKRFQTADSFSAALEDAARAMTLVGSHAEVGREVRGTVGDKLDKRVQDVRAAQAALEATKPRSDADSFDDEGTTQKYEPAKHALPASPPPVPQAPAPMALALPAPVAAAPANSQRIVFGLIAALLLTGVLVGIVVLSQNRSSSVSADTHADSVTHAAMAPSLPTTPPTNQAPVSAHALPSVSAEPDIDVETEPAATVASPATKSTNKPATTTKTKSRKLPPNPYGP